MNTFWNKCIAIGVAFCLLAYPLAPAWSVEKPFAALLAESCFTHNAIPPAPVIAFQKGLNGSGQETAARLNRNGEAWRDQNGKNRFSQHNTRSEEQEQFIAELVQYLDEEYQIKLTHSHQQLLNQFLKTPSDSRFSEEIETRLIHGEAVVKYSVTINFLPLILKKRSKEIPQMINSLLHPMPQFQQFFSKKWPVHKPITTERTIMLLNLVMSCIDEFDPTGASGKRVAGKYAGKKNDESVKLKAEKTQIGRRDRALHQHILSLLSMILGRWLPQGGAKARWHEFPLLLFRVELSNGSYLLIRNKNRAFIGDALEELLVSREAVRQKRWVTKSAMSRLMQSMLEGKSQANQISSLFDGHGQFPYTLESVEARSAFHEDVMFQIFMESNEQISLCNEAYVKLLIEAEHRGIFEPETSDFIKSWAAHLGVVADTDDGAEHAAMLATLFDLEKNALEQSHLYDNAATALSVARSLAHVFDGRLIESLPLHWQSHVRRRLLQALAILGIYSEGTVTPWLMSDLGSPERAWMSEYADFLAVYFGYANQLGQRLLTEAQQNDDWENTYPWTGFLQSLTPNTVKAVLHWGVHVADRASQTPLHEVNFLLGVVGNDPFRARMLLESLHLLKHHHEAGYKHDRPSWIVGLEELGDEIFRKGATQTSAANASRSA